jgi:hypothetical protein
MTVEMCQLLEKYLTYGNSCSHKSDWCEWLAKNAPTNGGLGLFFLYIFSLPHFPIP